ncbi:MAG: hypothetical protein AB8G23_04085 [Myxococcota bacterium]
MSTDRILVLGSDCDAIRTLTSALAREAEIDFEPLPPLGATDTFESWRNKTGLEAPQSRIVVAPWNDAPQKGALMELGGEQWRARFEAPFLLWNFALGAAARRVADGGSIVGLVQNAAALDAPGWTPEFAVADGALSLIRSVASSQGARGVRANLVSSPIGLVTSDVILPKPPLDLFPGSLEEEVAGSIRLLLSKDAKGLTGRLLPADGGRSL